MAVAVAKGIHNHPQFKLGSILGSGKLDKRTVDFMPFLDKTVQAPKHWDFDKKRKPFQVHLWGNDAYGDCELAGRANYLTRLQRGETRRTSPIVDDDVIDLYKTMTGCASPGDNNDSGLTTLDNLRQWRAGWLPKSLAGHANEQYQIAAFGYVDPKNVNLLSLCAYLFTGCLLGIDLPATAQQQIENNQPWDFVPNAGDAAKPGSWGGHCVYIKHYDENGVYALTWGREVLMTPAFIGNYVDEAYAVIESFDTWAHYKHVFDIQALIDQMKQTGINVQQ